MAYNPLQLRRADMFAQIGDFTARADTTTYNYNYRTVDTAATVETAAYFDTATFLQQGDVITAVMADTVGGTPVGKQYVVTGAISQGASHNVIALFASTTG